MISLKLLSVLGVKLLRSYEGIRNDDATFVDIGTRYGAERIAFDPLRTGLRSDASCAKDVRSRSPRRSVPQEAEAVLLPTVDPHTPRQV